jgi:tripartite-type tricarboxylate transporter receptor subunit TctC
VAKAAPDGYTFFMSANGPLLFSPTIFKRPVYDWKKDFVPVSSVSFTPWCCRSIPPRLQVAGRSAGRRAQARQHADHGLARRGHAEPPGQRVPAARKRRPLDHRALQGQCPATTDVLGGQVQFNFDQISVAGPFIQQGRTRALAVTSATRLPQLPDVPTLQEAGFKDFSSETFTGVLAPRGTPPDIVHKLSEALRKILADKSVQARFQTLGSEARASTPEQFMQFLVKEDQRWMPIIQQANINAE